jgi:uroporphyrinogen-III synthase
VTDRRLAGRRVLIGRSAGRSSGLIRLLARHGAAAQAVPLIEILPPADSGELDAAVLSLHSGDPDWVAFTSVNAVTAVLDRAAMLKVSPVVPAGTRVAAVGPATAGSLRIAGIAVDLMPATAGSGESLAAIFPTASSGQLVLLPRSAIAADTLPEELRAKGYAVSTAVAYRTSPRPLPASIATDLATGEFQALIVASPSAVGPLRQVPLAGATAVVAIGLPTARALAAAGLRCAAVAESPTDAAIVDELLRLELPAAPGGQEMSP